MGPAGPAIPTRRLPRPRNKLSGKAWGVIVALVVLLFVGGMTNGFGIFSGSSPKENSGGGKEKKDTGAGPTYNPTKICSMPKPVPVSGGLNNPLGIEFAGEYLRKVAEDSGIPKSDGGTFAKFPTREAGFDAGERLLRSKTGLYAGKTVEQATRLWSHGAYGAAVAQGKVRGDATVNDLPAADMAELLARMAIREHTDPVATAVRYTNPNDHFMDHTEEFFVEVPAGCFDYNWARAPRYWKGWHKEVVAEDPEAKVAIWFFGWDRPQGPFSAGTFPDYPYPPSDRWRMQSNGKGKVWMRYIQTS